jgi:hypothetical protein
MVTNNTTVGMTTLAILLSLWVPQIFAQTQLNASVDRSVIYENDTLNLRVTGNVDVDFSFGGILNFGRNQISSPDLSSLEQDFEILDQRQSHNMQMINGKSSSQVTWDYALAPKRSGTLSIPAIEYQGAKTDAISIQVNAGSAPKNADNPPLVFLEVEVDKPSAYVQEQLTYTVRLFSSDHLASGEWSEPEPLDAIVESLGDTNKFFRMAYNQRYEVREKKYLLFPQKSGVLNIEPQTFSGVLIDTRSRRRVRVNEISDSITVEVKSPPSSFSGEVWLPATSFELSERWDQTPDTLKVGDSLTRTLEIQSLGLLGSALPPLPTKDIPGLKVYPDQPEVESFEHSSGVQSRRVETTALVAVTPMETELPEIKIPWWDTVNDVERVAVVPSRKLNIAPGAASQSSSLPEVPSTSAPLSEQNDAGETALEVSPETAMPHSPEPNVTGAVSRNDHAWYALLALILFAWASTSWLLWQRGNRSLKDPQTKSSGADRPDLKHLIKTIKSQSPDIPRHVVAWVSDHLGNPRVKSISDLEAVSPVLVEQLLRFENARYGDTTQQAMSEPGYDADVLIGELKRVSGLNKHGSEPNDQAVLPFYP